MAPAADPCGDFYQYVCGGWIKKNPLPPGRRVWASFLDTDHSEEVLAGILASATGPIGDFHAACLDEAALAGSAPAVLREEFQRIDAVSDAASLARVVARMHLLRAQPLFTFFVTPDLHDTAAMELTLQQGGLGMGIQDRKSTRLN